MNEDLDFRLSALIDGELGADEAAALRAEVARRPELAARLAELAAVDDALRALPTRPLPAELRARLDERIRGEPGIAPLRSAQRALPRSAGGGRRAPSRAVRRWFAAAALAAAAAALALVVLTQLRHDDESRVVQTAPEPAAPAQIAEQPAVAPDPTEAPAPAPDVVEAPRVEIADEAPALVPAPAAKPAPEAEPMIPHDLLDPSDEPAAADVALAEDLPVIEVLDVLDELDELEEVGSG